MKVRKGVTVFKDGCLQKVDLDEKGRIVGSEPIKVEKAAPAGETKQELMALLKEKGIKFNATLSAAKLKELLTAEPEKKEPEGGTGNQEVI